MKVLSKFKAVMCIVMSLCIASFAVFCVTNRARNFISIEDNMALMAAFCVMPNADINGNNTKTQTLIDNPKSKNTDEIPIPKKVESTVVDTNKKKYGINETKLGGGNIIYDNFGINNSTSYELDTKALLNSELGFEFEDIRRAQVLVVHTHTCESYMSEDTGYYYEDFYPRTTDNNANVVAVGKAISDSLKAHNIGVVHATVQHDNPSYDGAYDRSYNTIMSYVNKYSEIKVVLDIHRDSMTTDDMTKIKPTFTYNGKKAAQIMIMTGHDDGDNEFPTWEQNLAFALKLQSECETLYPGMTRPLNFGEFTYNMNINSGSLLIEVGTDANTLEEALLTGEMLGNALAEVLQNQ